MSAAQFSSCYVCGEPAEEDRVLVSVSTAMEYCRVSRATLYRWMDEGRVEWRGLPSGRRRIFLDSMLREPSRHLLIRLGRHRSSPVVPPV